MANDTPDSIADSHAIVSAQWEWIRRCGVSYPHLVALVDAMGDFPQLAVLSPFLSVGRLCFSRCVFEPYHVDFVVGFWQGVYHAERSITSGSWVHTELFGAGSAQDALSCLASVVPPDYGPAVLRHAELPPLLVTGKAVT